MTDNTDNQTPDSNADRARFLEACSHVLGHCFPQMGDRALALAALSAACVKTPLDAPLDDALRSFVVAIAPLIGRASASEVELDLATLAQIKRRTLEDALSIGPAIIILDATMSGVDVPPHLKTERDLKFRLAWAGLVPPIDLALDQHGIRCVLSFNRTPYPVVVPWSAMWAVGSEVTHQGAAWPQGIDPEVMAAFERKRTGAPDPDASTTPDASARTAQATTTEAASKRARFGVIAGGAEKVAFDTETHGIEPGVHAPPVLTVAPALCSACLGGTQEHSCDPDTNDAPIGHGGL